MERGGSRRELLEYIAELEGRILSFDSEVFSLKQENAQLRQKYRALKKENAELKLMLKQAGSVNNKLRLQAYRIRSSEPNAEKKKRGPSFGHAGHNRQLPDKIDEIKHWTCTRCPKCDSALSGPVDHRQHVQIELPPSRPVVQQHIVERRWCRNCKKLVEPMVRGIIPNSQYGPRIIALAAHLKYGLGLTFGKIQKLFREQWGIEISIGCLSEMMTRLGGWLDPVYKELQTEVRQSEVLNADETHWRVEKQNYWLWCFTNKNVVLYHINKSRGSQVVNQILGDTFDGTLCTDFYAAYNRTGANRQRCLVHLLRDCKELLEKKPVPKETERLCRSLSDLVKRAFDLKSMEKELPPPIYKKRGEQLKMQIRKLAEARYTNHDAARIAKRLIRFWNELFVFLEKSDVKPHNNDAEIQVRPAVLMRKTSYTNRSDKGRIAQEVIMSVVQTCRKRVVDFLQFTETFINEKFSSGGTSFKLPQAIPKIAAS